MVLGILLIAVAVVILIILSVIGWWIGTFNRFQNAIQDMKEQWSNVKAEYQRRADLFMNLVESVRSYKEFENKTLREVIQARGGNFGATKEEEARKMNELEGIFSRLMVVFERYPELKASKAYGRLMKEIRITEDRINYARTEYNDIVGEYNKIVRMFPTNIIARRHNFFEEAFFESEQGTEKAPAIKIEN